METKLRPEFVVSACLCGERVRYDGGGFNIPGLRLLAESGRAVPVCPECLGGLPTPRCPAEIRASRVLNREGVDVTAAYEAGARQVLELCRRLGIRRAILKENSPSCGCRHVYDGTFSGHKIPGAGVAARLLMDNGVEVLTEDDWQKMSSE